MGMSVSMVIPCYWDNQHLVEVTKRCISSLAFSAANEILIVDDGSRIKLTKADIAPIDLQIITREHNGGYAAAVNTGMKEAIGDIFVIANNDLVFIQPDWLDKLLHPIYNDEADISLISQTDTDGWTPEEKYTHNAKFGALWAITREAYERLGTLDERFGKGYFEDLDYWHRAQDKNMVIIKNHAGIVEHIGKQTFKLVDEDDKLFGINMFKYNEKWPNDSYLVETKPNEVILVDKYEYETKTPDEQRFIRNHAVTLEEAKARWTNA